MADRQQLRDAFLAAQGWKGARIATLAGDASFRRYFRLVNGPARAVLMDAPPPQEDVGPYVAIARQLTALDLSAPEIYGEDAGHGFLLIEDFGDDTYTRVLDRGGEERELYELATDTLLALHAHPAHRAVPPGAPDYRSERMLDTAQLLIEWFYPATMGQAAPAELVEEFRAILAKPLAWLDAGAQTLVLRDYHVDNLMLLPDRPGVQACGLLDFQDGARGSIAYDLVSLLEDARRDIALPLRQAMLDHYIERSGVDRRDFLAACAIAGAQRHSRIVGQFVRLQRRDNKPAYLRHVLRVWALLERALRHDMLAEMRQFLDRTLPGEKRTLPQAMPA